MRGTLDNAIKLNMTAPSKAAQYLTVEGMQFPPVVRRQRDGR
jgi:hypothetical protein